MNNIFTTESVIVKQSKLEWFKKKCQGEYHKYKVTLEQHYLDQFPHYFPSITLSYTVTEQNLPLYLTGTEEERFLGETWIKVNSK